MKADPDKPCEHKVCNKNQSSTGPWHCYLSPGPPVTDFTTFGCHCGTVTQGGPAGLAAHQHTVHRTVG